MSGARRASIGVALALALASGSASAEERRPLPRRIPAARVLFGAAIPSSSALPAGFAFDVGVGAQLTSRKDLGIWPELSYSLVDRGGRLDHLAGAGLGPVLRGRSSSIGALVKGLGGAVDRRAAGGVRLSLAFGAAAGLLSVEIASQWLRLADVGQGPDELHELRLSLGVDVMAVIAVFTGVSIVRAMRPTRPSPRRG
ncbi:MAG: hypothetical protein R3B09_34640 [Nannocystaceae bacterium]